MRVFSVDSWLFKSLYGWLVTTASNDVPVETDYKNKEVTKIYEYVREK